MEKKKRASRTSTTVAHLSPEAVDAIDRVAAHLPYSQRGQQTVALVVGACEIVAARPELFGRALGEHSTARNAYAFPVGRAWGRLAAEALAVPVLPEGWEIERIGHVLTLTEPSGIPAARIDSGGMHLISTAYHSPAVLGAAIAAFVAAAGGAS